MYPRAAGRHTSSARIPAGARVGGDTPSRARSELGEGGGAPAAGYDCTAAMRIRTRTARITLVEPLEGFVVRLRFDDGSTREIDLEKELWGPVFEPLRSNPELFRQVEVDPELG